MSIILISLISFIFQDPHSLYRILYLLAIARIFELYASYLSSFQVFPEDKLFLLPFPWYTYSLIYKPHFVNICGKVYQIMGNSVVFHRDFDIFPHKKKELFLK